MKATALARTAIRRRSLHRAPAVLALAVVLGSPGCGAEVASDSAGGSAGTYFPTTSVVFGQDSISTYLSLLRSIDTQEIDYGAAREFAGWADLWAHEGKAFVSDGEAPVVTRYSMASDGALEQEGRLSFAHYGTDTAAFWRNVFVAPAKAYLFVPAAREVVVWNPQSLEITGTFALPELDDRGSQQLYLTTDRSAVVRGDRLYVPVAWGNWGDVSLSHDSVVLVIDTTADEVVSTLPVACPDLNVGTIDERGDIYFSNWVYGVTPALFEGGPRTCAARIEAGWDVIDPNWSLTFADVTGGREAAALRFIGDGKALISVFHDEEGEITAESERYATLEQPHWRFWTLDLETRETEPVEALGWHSGGYYSSRIGERNLLFVPSADYASTRAIELSVDGSVEPRWEATGWVTRLFELSDSRGEVAP